MRAGLKPHAGWFWPTPRMFEFICFFFHKVNVKKKTQEDFDQYSHNAN